MQNQTVLFASRNHKAIDAVMGRLTIPDGRQLIVRTNSKDDPSLNYNFTHAIRDILNAPPQPQSAERLYRTREEILALLDDRGRKAALSRQIAEAVMELGQIEERKSYVAQSLPPELSDFIDRHPEHFPIQVVSRVLQTIKPSPIQSDEKSFIGSIFPLLKRFMMMPWYCSARRKLRQVPFLLPLPAFPWFSTFNMQPSEFSVLERAMEFARLRIASFPYETRLKQLPSAEEITAEIVRITQRIEDVAPHAISLDLENRFNLDDSVNREQLDGPRAAFYYQPAKQSPLNLELMRIIDKIYTKCPFYGAPRITHTLIQRGYPVGHKRMFCIEALEDALLIGQPEIFNSDQGSQFTSNDFINALKRNNIRISMDGRGRALDNIMIERLWRSVKYEEVYLKDYQNVRDAFNSLFNYMDFYNNKRIHQHEFIRAFAAISQDLTGAGYTDADVIELNREVEFYADIRAAIKRYAGEELDIKPYEADMRHLLNTNIPRPSINFFSSPGAYLLPLIGLLWDKPG